MHTHYDNLKVPRDATQAQIKAAYRKLRSKHHPDRNSDPLSTQRMHVINAAWEVLSDPVKRKKHDAEIDRKEQFEEFFREMEEEANQETKAEEAPKPEKEEEYVSTEDWPEPEDDEKIAAMQRYFELAGEAWEHDSRTSVGYSKVDPTYRVFRTDFTVGNTVYYYYSCYKADIAKRWQRVKNDLRSDAELYGSGTLSPRLANQELMNAMLANKGVLWSVGEPRGDVTAPFFRKG
jgi:curved DNA-binding protein CbpA